MEISQVQGHFVCKSSDINVAACNIAMAVNVIEVMDITVDRDMRHQAKIIRQHSSQPLGVIRDTV